MRGHSALTRRSNRGRRWRHGYPPRARRFNRGWPRTRRLRRCMCPPATAHTLLGGTPPSPTPPMRLRSNRPAHTRLVWCHRRPHLGKQARCRTLEQAHTPPSSTSSPSPVCTVVAQAMPAACPWDTGLVAAAHTLRRNHLAGPCPTAVVWQACLARASVRACSVARHRGATTLPMRTASHSLPTASWAAPRPRRTLRAACFHRTRRSTARGVWDPEGLPVAWPPTAAWVA